MSLSDTSSRFVGLDYANLKQVWLPGVAHVVRFAVLGGLKV